MKKIILLCSTLLITISSFCQVTSLNENFNTSCPTGYNPPMWITYNPIMGTSPAGKWQCAATSGRSGTPGTSCSGLYGTPLTYHHDTSIFVSPELNLTGYAGDIYVNFDTKTSNYNLGAKMEILASKDSTMGTDTLASTSDTIYNLTPAMTPIFGNPDQADWVTHQVDLTPFKSVVPLYIGFRYVSFDGTNGSRWYLDNIMTTTVQLVNVEQLTGNSKRLQVSGNVQNGTLRLALGVPATDKYDLTITDMAGRQLHHQQVALQAGENSITLTDLSFATGMYIVKLANAHSFGVTRVPVW